jgi:hypothetical protein
MRHDPFAHLNLEQIEAAEKKYRAAHPFLWRAAEAIVFVRERGRWSDPHGSLSLRSETEGRDSLEVRRPPEEGRHSRSVERKRRPDCRLIDAATGDC